MRRLETNWRWIGDEKKLKSMAAADRAVDRHVLKHCGHDRGPSCDSYLVGIGLSKSFVEIFEGNRLIC